MSQPTPTTTAKRKVMGRMDVGLSDPPSSSSNTTPTTRPKIIRAHHGASSPALSSSATPSSMRAIATGARAKVDMSTFASPSSVVSSPSMSPSVQRPPFFASSAASSAITARVSAPSPSLRTSTNGHMRANSTLGSSSPSVLRSPELDRESSQASSPFVTLRATRARTRDGSIDLGGPNPFASPGNSGSEMGSQMSASASTRTIGPRANLPQLHRTSAPVANGRATSTITSRPPMSPQRSKDSARFPSPTPRSRSPSPIGSRPTQPNRQIHDPSFASPYQMPEKQAPRLLQSGTDRSDRLGLPEATPSEPRDRALSSPAISRELAHIGASQPLQSPNATMTTGRAHMRAHSFQRASIPAAILTDARTNVPTTPLSPTEPVIIRPSALQRSSFASNASYSRDAPLLSPSSEVPKSPSEIAEAEEARIHRKLLDLEITNKSLMAINSALEVTKLKQAKEIRELKRRIREGRGLTPGPAGTAANPNASFSDEDELSDDNDQFLVEEDPELEAAHLRCKNLVDQMVVQARKAILYEYEAKESSGSKVLHPAEVEQMRREQEDEGGDESEANRTIDLVDSSNITLELRADTSRSGISSSASSSSSILHLGRAETSLEAAESMGQTTPEVEIDSSFVDDAPQALLRDASASNSQTHPPFKGDVSID